MFGRVHYRGVLTSDEALSSSLTSTSSACSILLEDWIGWGLPSDTQLLDMDHLIAVLDLLAESTDLILVHRPNLIESVLVTFLESFVFLLKEQEVFGELFVVLGHLLVVVSEGLMLGLELALDSSEHILVLSFPLFEVVKSLLVDLFSFLEDSVIELELLFVESVNSLHILHALLKYLHFFLKLNLLFSLVVGVLSLQFFKFVSVLFVVL